MVALLLTAWLVLPGAAALDQTLTPAEAADHLGEQATVCGKVATARYAAASRGKPTFLNLDAPYPKSIFMVVIWGNDREKFGAPEIAFRDRNICVTGRISSYRGEPQIVVTEPKQITIRPK
jgi:hypothetical protein